MALELAEPPSPVLLGWDGIDEWAMDGLAVSGADSVFVRC
jgi:hypothetical protein